MGTDVLSAVRAELRENADEKTRDSTRRFFKEEVVAYGVKSAAVGAITRKYFKEVKSMGKSKIFALCEKLWQSVYIEESFVACEWAYRLRDEYEEEDLKVFERWINNYVNNWPACDTLCNHTVGSFIERYPQYIDSLKKWAKSGNRWVKRAAAVTLILPARKGKFLKDVFEIADILLMDQDDLVQKGYGWMLKEASRLHQTEVFDYVFGRRAVMPRTALRYAIEKIPKELRGRAMEKP